MTGSTAIDGGSSSIAGVIVPTYDERGAERGPGGLNAGPTVDIGAYEASSSYLVTTTAIGIGYGSIVSAVAWANVSFNDNPANLANPAPNTVTFDSANLFSSPRTLTLSAGPLEFSNVTTPEAIQGTGVTNLTISGGNSFQVFKVNAGATVTLGGMTITGGKANSGGAVDNFGTLTVSGARMQGNSASTFGGAIRNESNATLVVNNSTFTGDTAAEGGAIYNEGSLTVTGRLFRATQAPRAVPFRTPACSWCRTPRFPAIRRWAQPVRSAMHRQEPLRSSDPPSRTTPQLVRWLKAGRSTPQARSRSPRARFTSNSADNGGGAIYYNFASSPLSIIDSSFTSNTAGAGGAVICRDRSQPDRGYILG